MQKNGHPPRFGRMAYLGLAVAGVSVLIFLTAAHIEQKSMATVTDLMVVIPGRLHDGLSTDPAPLGSARKEEQ